MAPPLLVPRVLLLALFSWFSLLGTNCCSLYPTCLVCGGPLGGGSDPQMSPGSFGIRVTFGAHVSAVIWLAPNSILEF
jgi:hypothetical protein